MQLCDCLGKSAYILSMVSILIDFPVCFFNFKCTVFQMHTSYINLKEKKMLSFEVPRICFGIISKQTKKTNRTRSGNRSGHSRMIFAGGSDPKLTLTR